MSCGFPRQRNLYNAAVVQEKTRSRQTNFWFVVVFMADSVTETMRLSSTHIMQLT